MMGTLSVNGLEEGECALVNLNEVRRTPTRLIGQHLVAPRGKQCTMRASIEGEHLLVTSRLPRVCSTECEDPGRDLLPRRLDWFAGGMKGVTQDVSAEL
jgi:hypothetical protein